VPLETDARLVAATNRDLEALVKEQRFRGSIRSTLPSGPAPFYGRLISIDKIKGVQPYLENEALNPGVATFLATGPEAVRPKDTRLVWKIEEAALRERVNAPGPSLTRPPQPANVPSLTIHD